MNPRLRAALCCAATLLAGAVQARAPDAQQVASWREQARAHEHGEGVARQMDLAVELYCKAALAGDTESRYSLGWIYANGRGVERNDAYAVWLFRQAADQGDEPSRRMAERLGVEAAKPPCVLAAEAAERERVARERAAAEAARLAAENERQAQRYRDLIDTAQRRQIMAIVDRVAPEYGIHPGLAAAVIRAESNFDPLAVSDKNAQGLMQLIPETAQRFRVKKPFDPEQNIRGGLAYLRWLLAYFQGNVSLAVAAYNAGEGAVERYRGVPPFPETQGYLRRIQEVFNLQQHPYDARVTAPSPLLPRPRLGH
jgi:TPR repeat protein